MEAFCFGELLRTEETKISQPKEKEKSSSRENFWQKDRKLTGTTKKREKKRRKKTCKREQQRTDAFRDGNLCEECEDNTRECLFVYLFGKRRVVGLKFMLFFKPNPRGETDQK